jgi:hypothetical protein
LATLDDHLLETTGLAQFGQRLLDLIDSFSSNAKSLSADWADMQTFENPSFALDDETRDYLDRTSRGSRC